jgi:hypothetical protein
MLSLIIQNQESFMSTIDDLVTAVAAEDTAIGGALAAINGLTAQVAALKTGQTDPATAAKIDSLVADITAQTAAIGAAITTPAPASPPPAVAPVPDAPVVADAPAAAADPAPAAAPDAAAPTTA